MRDAVLPRLLDQPGLSFLYAGRAGPDDIGQRIIATIWERAGAAEEIQADLAALFDFEQLEDMSGSAVELYPLAVALPFEHPDEPRILRVFRGQTQPGELDAYVEAAREGTYADVMAAHGPAALFLGVQRPDRFATVSVWTVWENIEAATGGNLRRPIATKHTQQLVEGGALHYEIVPNTITGSPPVKPGT